MRRTPRVSIGLPVYNGANYLAKAIESVLCQSFDDFELIISDNASTDETANICRRYAAKDTRVRYMRQPDNFGAAPNFNAAFVAASGEYFRWHAHDDLLEPKYLERCVEALDRHADAVFSHSRTMLIDSSGAPIRVLPDQLPGASSARVSDRFRANLGTHNAVDYFGLFRRKIFEDSLPLRSYPGSDKLLLAELALRGRFVFVDEPLFLNRHHLNRYQKRIKWEDRARWFDTSTEVHIALPALRVWLDYADQMRRRVVEPSERRRCYLALAEYWTHRVHLRWLRQDIILALFGPNGTGYRRLRRALEDRISAHKNGGDGARPISRNIVRDSGAWPPRTRRPGVRLHVSAANLGRRESTPGQADSTGTN